MQEAVIAVIVLIVAVVMGSLFQPTEAQLRPLSPDQIKGPGGGHGAGQAEASGHHH